MQPRDAVHGDDGTSPVLVAVVNEFAKKAGKAAVSPDERVAVIELHASCKWSITSQEPSRGAQVG